MTAPDVTKIPDHLRAVTFHEREFWVLEPSDTQILALTRLANLKPSAEMSLERMMGTLNRMPALIETLCERDSDKEWFEDAYATKAVEVHQLPDFCVEVLRAWFGDPEPPNRATKRAAAKKTGVRRVR